MKRDAGLFDRFATAVAEATGRAYAFAAAVLLVVLWIPTFLVVRDIDTWQLIINTTTTIVTFLMVFLIQSTQNRDTKNMMLLLMHNNVMIERICDRLDVDTDPCDD